MVAKLLCASPVACCSVAFASPCPPIELQPQVLTPQKTAISAGVVVAWVGDWQRLELPYDEDVTEWKVASKSPVLTELAPGLEIIVAAPSATAVVDKNGATIVEFTVATKVGAILSPPARVTVTRTAADPKTTRHPWVRTTAKLAGAPPAGVVALVVLAHGKPVSYGIVGKERGVEVFGDTTCNPHPAGTVDVQPGESVQLAWVDAGGRVSKPSRAIKVVGAVAR